MNAPLIDFMTIELLKPFCSTDKYWPSLNSPWTRDGFTYATDGRLIVRVPAIPDVPDNLDAPNVACLEWRLMTRAEFAPLPELPEPLRETCDGCEGSGKQACGVCACKECVGTGFSDGEKQNGIQVGTHLIDAALLRRIAALPNPRIAQNGDALQAVPFTFDGGDGLVMPMRV